MRALVDLAIFDIHSPENPAATTYEMEFPTVLNMSYVIDRWKMTGYSKYYM